MPTNNNILVNNSNYEKVLDPKYGDNGIVIDFYQDSDTDKENGCGISCAIESNDVLLYSVGNLSRKALECEGIAEMFFSEPLVYSTFANGKPVDKLVTLERLKRECKLFEQGNPYSKYSIFDKENEFVGRIVLEGCDDPHPETGEDMGGIAEIGIAITTTKQRKGFGTDAVAGITYGLAAYLSGYRGGDGNADSYPITHEKFNGESEQLELISLYATASPQNGTYKIFDRCGYNLGSTYTHGKYKQQRTEFQLSVKEIVAVCERSKLKFT